MSRRSKKKLIVGLANDGTSAYGTDFIDAGGTGQAIQTTGLEITPLEGEEIERELDDGKSGSKPMIMSGIHVKLSGSVEAAGSGDAITPVKYQAILQCAGRTATVGTTEVTYTRINDNSEPDATFYYYNDGALHKLVGARATSGASLKVGELPTFTFEITGLYGGVVDTGMPSSPDFSGFQTPLKVGHENTTFMLDGTEYPMFEFEYEENNEVSYSENTIDEEIDITDWKPDGTIVIEAPALSDFDPFSIATSNAQLPLSITHGLTEGNIVSIASAAIQLGKPTYGDREGKLTLSMPFRFIDDPIIESK